MSLSPAMFIWRNIHNHNYNHQCQCQCQGGAEYDGREESLTRYERSAKSKKEGLWSQANGETPAQYKARMKRQQPAGARR